MTPARCRALLALLLYAGIGVGSPLADALVSHRGVAGTAQHIEAAGEPGCHHATCLLAAPGAPQSPAPPAPAAAAPTPVTAGTAPVALASQHHDRTPARQHGPRAPPLLG